MKKDPRIFLIHIEECISLIEEYTKGMLQKDFLADFVIQDAVVRRLEIIGEAVKNIPLHTKKEYPKVAWPKIIALRNKLIHEYFSLNLKLVWQVVRKDIPKLKVHVNKALKEIT